MNEYGNAKQMQKTTTQLHFNCLHKGKFASITLDQETLLILLQTE